MYAGRTVILHPAGSFRTAWNMITALCVLYDLIVIPLYAFNLPNSVPLTVFGWIIMLFWNMDLVISFLTGYYDEGALVQSSARVAIHYARTWLLFDLSLISLDWVLAGMDMTDSGEEQAAWSRTLRMLRFLRLIRMLRWIKLRQANEALQDLLHSQARSAQTPTCGCANMEQPCTSCTSPGARAHQATPCMSLGMGRFYPSCHQYHEVQQQQLRPL